MASSVEQIKSKLGIVDVVSSYVKLQKAGSNFKARCPFHNERTPSFFISPARDSFHCFGCSRGGDILTFVQEIEGVDFKEALRILADRAGVQLQFEEAGARSEKQKLRAVLESASLFYQEELQKNKSVMKYLVDRGLLAKTVADFQIGFAPDGWQGTYLHLKGQGFSDAEIEKSGLSLKSAKSGRHFDRFRRRIMFPLNDASGRLVGFSGRIFQEKPGSTEGKYINSPQNTLFDKSQVLFGFERAKRAIRTSGSCILVEGQFDVVMSHQAGVENTVAVSGTALSAQHIALISRLAGKLVMAFDADEAGLAALGRSVDLALSAGLDVTVAPLPAGQDPADLAKANPTHWKNIVESSKHIIDFYLDLLSVKHQDIRQLRLEVEKKVLPYVKSVQSKIDQAHFISQVARVLKMEEAPLWAALESVNAPAWAAQLPGSTELAQMVKTRRAKLEERLAGIILWQKGLQDPQINLTEVESGFKNAVGHSADNGAYSQEEAIFEAEAYYDRTQDLQSDFRELLQDLKQEILKEEFQQLTQMLKSAEEKGDQKLAHKYILKCNQIIQELNSYYEDQETSKT